MKIERFNEDYEFDVKLNDLNNKLYEILYSELAIENVPYTDDLQISDYSVRNTVDKIVSYFGGEELLYLINTKKFNL